MIQDVIIKDQNNNEDITKNYSGIKYSKQTIESYTRKKIKIKDMPFKIHIISKEPSLKSGPCNYRTTNTWAMTKFGPKDDKTLIWMGCFYPTVPSWGSIRTRYGFKKILCSEDRLSVARNYGFTDDNIILSLPGTNDQPDSELNNAKQIALRNSSLSGYFVDEPFEYNRYSLSGLNELTDYINNNISGKLLSVCSFRNPDASATKCPGDLIEGSIFKYLAFITKSNARIGCDKYDYSTLYLQPTLTTYWSDFKNWYLTKNNMNWMRLGWQQPDAIENPPIYAHDSWNDLFPHANNLGINIIGIYADINEITDHNLFDFGYGAWRWQWLHGFAEHITIVERCDLPIPCDCQKPENEDQWYIDQMVYHGDFWEVFP